MREMEALRNPKGELGKWLAAELRARRLTGREASREMGASHSQVINWLGGRQPEPASTGKLADWAGIKRREVQRMAGYPLDPECGGDAAPKSDELRTVQVQPEDVSIVRRVLGLPRRAVYLSLAAMEAMEKASERPFEPPATQLDAEPGQ